MALYEEFGDRRRDFEILAFHDTKATSFDDLDAKLASVRQQHWGGKQLPFPILLDSTGETLRRYGVNGFPTIVVIDPKGKVVKHGSEWTVRDHLLQTDKAVRKMLKRLKAARNPERFAEVVADIRDHGGKHASFALSFLVREDAKPFQVEPIAEALARIKGPYALGFFFSKYGIGSEDKAARLRAAGMLGELCEIGHLMGLNQLIESERDEEVREALRSATQKIVERSRR